MLRTATTNHSPKAAVERSLEIGDYAIDKQEELRQLDQYLEQLNYNEQDHALARSEVERWRWAEIRQGKSKTPRGDKRCFGAATRNKAQIAAMNARIEQEQIDSDCAKQIAAIERYIAEIGYDTEQHNALRTALREAQSWQLRYQQLSSAQQQYPQLRQRSQDLTQLLQTRLAERQIAAQMEV